MENVLYDLVAVINHRGGIGGTDTTQFCLLFIAGGHYVAYAKNHKTSKWYEFDDSVVTPVSEEYVKNSEAYVLFFQKRMADTRREEIQKIEAKRKEQVNYQPFYLFCS